VGQGARQRDMAAVAKTTTFSTGFNVAGSTLSPTVTTP
jgi:hypothetical protein